MNMSRKAICITYHERSLESFENKGHILKMIGVGRRRGGRPIGNQQYDAQLEFLNTASIQKTFSVFSKDGTETYMGEYSLHSFTKKVSFEGFTYFLFTLHRVPPS